MIRRQLDRQESAAGRALERLSSGLRINHAGDDAAGLAVAMQLGADQRVFGKAVANVNDGISYLNVADQAVGSLKEITTRMRELATASANGTLSEPQRGALDKEFQQLAQEYDRVLETTTFNGAGVFLRQNSTVSFQAGYGVSGIISSSLRTTTASAADAVAAMSVASDGTLGNGTSTLGLFAAGSPTISADGRYVVFASTSTNLVAGVTDGLTHVFRHDRLTGQTSVVDTTAAGQLANATGGSASLSSDGRYVSFSTTATNLSSSDTNGVNDVYIKDMQTGQLTLASQVNGTAGTADSTSSRLSGDGRYVLFTSAATNFGFGGDGVTTSIYRKDLVTGQMALASSNSSGTIGNGASSLAEMSGDGRYVVFTSNSSNLVAGATTGVFYKDMLTGETRLASSKSDGTSGDGTSTNASITADGRYVVFNSTSTNFAANDTNGVNDIYYKDMQTGAITLLSQTAAGVAGDQQSSRAMLSADGRYVSFGSTATNLVSGDTNAQPDILIKDLRTGAFALASVTSEGQISNGSSILASMSADGQYIIFQSTATNLVSGDSNGVSDIFAGGNPLVNHYSTSRMQWLSVDSQGNAQSAQTYLDGYLTELSQVQAAIGSSLSRLEVAGRVSQASADTAAAAGSRITDADIGAETAALTRTRILQQAGVALLAQANQQPQLAIKLLRRG